MSTVAAFHEPRYAAYLRGLKRYSKARPMPPRPADDDPCTSIEAMEWIGWMIARAMEMDTVIKGRERAMQLLDVEYSDADLSEFDIGEDGLTNKQRRKAVC